MPRQWDEQWNNNDLFLLPRYASPGAYDWLRDRLPSNPDASNRDEEGRRRLIRTLYEALCKQGIRYRLEKSLDERGINQGIRQPRAVLDHPREGTCLDLALVFCGLCISARMIPWIVLVRGHAFAAVSLVHGWDDWMKARDEWEDFLHAEDGRLKLLDDPRKLAEYLDEDRGRYLVVECTGFADSRGVLDGSEEPEALGRDAGGLLPFEAALEAGRAQLANAGRPLLFAIDLAVAQRNCGIEPFDVPPPGGSRSQARERPTRGLECLVDRVSQRVDIEKELEDGLAAKSGRPSLFVLAGDPDQGHKVLINRLEQFDLRDLLDRLHAEASSLLVRLVDLPPPGFEDFDRTLRSLLARVLPPPKLNPSPTWDDLGIWLSNYRGQTLFYSSFSVERDWEKDRHARIEAWLRAWEECPDLTPPLYQPPIVCLNVIYKRPPTGFWHRLARRFRGDGNLELAGYLRSLQQVLGAGARFPKIRAARLADLDGVLEQHVRDWHDDPRVEAFRGDADFTRHIRAYFAGLAPAAAGAATMDDVVAQARGWLKDPLQGV